MPPRSGSSSIAELWTALTFVLGLTFRLLAIRYKWEMPKFVFSEDRQ